MQLEGSCHCGAVHFTLQSTTPYPYMRCYCSICRKTQGGGGYAINIMGEADTLHVTGRRHLRVYQAMIDGKESPAQRHFCNRCGAALYIADPRWPEWVYPFASAIDSELPVPPETQHIMLNDKAGWVQVPKDSKADQFFPEYPEEAIIDWHRKRDLVDE